MELTDQQAIDHLNTIINERESAVHLKEVLKQAMTAQERVAAAAAEVNKVEKQITGMNVALQALEQEYAVRKASAEATHQATLAGMATKLKEAEANYQHRLSTIKLWNANMDKEKVARQAEIDRLGKEIEKKLDDTRAASTAYKLAVDKYEVYKASL